MLLARVQPDDTLSVTPLRGVFARDDAWLATGDLFRRDADGDYWRLDGVGDVIRTADGPVFTAADPRRARSDSRRSTWRSPTACSPTTGEPELAVAAVTLRAGRTLSARDIGRRAVGCWRATQRPALVHVVDEIPVTTWFGRSPGRCATPGSPSPAMAVPAWYLDAAGETYRPLTAAARQRLTRPRPARRLQAGSVSPE